MDRLYVYAVIPTGDRGVLDVAGVDDDNGDVYTIPYRDVAAVVSTSPLADYRGLNRNQAARHLIAHQRVVEAIMRDYPVLPVRFGTVLPGENWVRLLLMQGRDLLHSILEQVAGLVQMEVLVLWNLQQVFQEISREPHIVQLKSQIAGRPQEETVVERVAVGQMVQASLEQRRAALRDYLLPSLRKVAVDVVINPSMDDNMVANAALLLEEADRQTLDHQLESLDQEFEGRLLFRCVGPLPPYSFATVDVQVPSFESVDSARRLLGLKDRATAGEVKQAYHRLASRFHPDRNREDPDAQARMAGLAQAHQALTAYVEAMQARQSARKKPGNGSTGQPLEISFDQQDVEQALLISVRRQESAT